jgi:type IV pilus assembly protein PilQ
VAEKIKQAKAIVQALDTVTPQVIIEARIVEASTSFSREIGTEWGMQAGIQSTDANAGIGPQRGFDTLGGTYGYEAAVNFPGNMSNTSSGTLGFNFTRIAGTPLLLEARLRAMESRGEGRIISAPKILTLDNKKAIIKQGLEYPYLERDDSGGATTKFKDIDLLLEVTPHVTPDDRISMILHITKNDIGVKYGDQQSFTTKEAQTELLINDGETVVIGGIIKTTKNTGESGLPGFSKIPILGWLFKTKSNSSRKEELLIFITPRIVKLQQRELL